MPMKFPDRVRETCTGSGSGALTLAGSAPTRYRTLDAALSDGDEFPGLIEHRTAIEWQTGRYRYDAGSPGTVSLVELYESSTGSALSWSAGIKDIEVTLVGRSIEDIMNGRAVTFTPTLLTAPYVSGDVLFNPMSVGQVFPSLGGRANLLSVGINDLAAVGLAMDLLFFKTAVSLGTQGDAVSLADADLQYMTGVPVRISAIDYTTLGANMRGGQAGLGIGVAGAVADDDLYVGAIARAGGTFAANSLSFELVFA